MFTKEEKEFLVNLLGSLQIKASEPNVIPTVQVIQSVLSKIQGEEKVEEEVAVGEA